MKTLTSRSCRIESYDRLMLATGSDPFIIPVPGAKLPGVVTFRDMDDVAAMLRAADESRNAVVIGGGLLGLEAAHGPRGSAGRSAHGRRPWTQPGRPCWRLEIGRAHV